MVLSKKRFKRIIIAGLCVAVLGNTALVYAAETPEEHVDEAVETIDEVVGPEVSSETEDTQSETHVITGFADFDIQDHYLYYSPDDRPDMDELISEMPDTLEVYLDDSDEATEIDVTWYDITEDYEEERSYYFQFSPEWDESEYELADGLDVWEDAPYIGVFFNLQDSDGKLMATVTGNTNETLVYHYLKNTMKVSDAVACGVLANIQCESYFNPNARFTERSGLVSYGICQWNGERLDAMKSREGDKYTTITGQLDYLYYELQHSESSAWKKVLNCDNTASGAYSASYNWARYFERCAEYYNGVAQYVQRARLARDKYWPVYTGLTSDTFSDVLISYDCYEAVEWAVKNEITTGFSDGTFRPWNTCNRAAVVTFLWRLAGKPNPTKTADFKDMTGNVEFDKAISWAEEEGITTGFSDGTFRPWNNCNRAAIVTFLWRYAEKAEPSKAADFKDMTGNAEFDKAISWAEEKRITTGWSDKTFRPWNNCSRAAIVQFLYRYANL